MAEKIKLNTPVTDFGETVDSVELGPLTVKVMRETARIDNPELRELAIIERLTGLTQHAIDQLSIADLEAIQEKLRPQLPDSLMTGLTLSGFSLGSVIGDLQTLTPSGQKNLPSGLPSTADFAS